MLRGVNLAFRGGVEGMDALEWLGIFLRNVSYSGHSGQGRCVSNWGRRCCTALVCGLEGIGCWNFESES